MQYNLEILASLRRDHGHGVSKTYRREAQEAPSQFGAITNFEMSECHIDLDQIHAWSASANDERSGLDLNADKKKLAEESSQVRRSGVCRQTPACRAQHGCFVGPGTAVLNVGWRLSHRIPFRCCIQSLFSHERV